MKRLLRGEACRPYRLRYIWFRSPLNIKYERRIYVDEVSQSRTYFYIPDDFCGNLRFFMRKKWK
ncbi:MAG: hypothetical protein LBJ00_00055 [Planctomycetaceae bacterium]|nr:hypothetical protein [Planctomycetaceae bacterium]